MSDRLPLTPEQQRAYDRYITARNKVGIVRIKGSKRPWIPLKDYISTVDIAGMNHPLFELNEDWAEYNEAFMAWLAIEPEFRDQERLRMTRGDYGVQDSWEIKQ